MRLLLASRRLSRLEFALRAMHVPSFPKRIWMSYQDKLQAGGVVGVAAKCVTSALIAAAGDLGCQVWIEGRRIQFGSADDASLGELAHSQATGIETTKQFDSSRFTKFTILGGVLVAPTLHVWYGYLGRLIPGQTIPATIKRVTLDQFIFAPAFIATFFAALAQLEGKSREHFQTQMQEEWPGAVVNNWKLWIPAQCINLGLVPPHLQVLFSNCVAVVWNVYLSLVTHKAPTDSTPK